MSPVLIFDLDDTLYPEHSFVESGFRAVAEWLQSRHGWDAGSSLEIMRKVFARDGRGAVFDRLLEMRGRDDRREAGQCVRVYRHHRPQIHLYPSAEKIFSLLRQQPYVVTDGHKIVQHNKVIALNLEERCKKIFITHRYGIKHVKPSTLCFERIRQRERCEWRDMIYVGDNPAKDFVGLIPLGARTVRVLTGMHRRTKAPDGHEAGLVIESLAQLPDALPDIDWFR